MSELPAALERLRRAAPSMRELLEQGLRAARSNSPILILGAPGSGRSTLARALHQVSQRREESLVEIDPGSLPSSLFESEMFGFVAGAFTGADEGSEGRVGRARGGSLLLDHVEETPIAAQAKLLRLVAEQRFAPLGGVERDADVRILAIGPDDLEDRIGAGTFRADLFYRLEVLTLRIPVLRRRMTDLPSLVTYFLDDLGSRFGREDLRLSGRALEWMTNHTWPGNLRQLRNTLEREIVLSRSPVVDPRAVRGAHERPASLAEMEKAQIERALEYTRGHQGKAAQLLGISRKSLWQKRKRFGIP